MSTIVERIEPETLGARLSVEKMPAHWLMARLGKRVLRPGGREATRWLVEQSRIEPVDDVVELAPGLGVTARKLLARRPRSYVGIEHDRRAAELAGAAVARSNASNARVLRGDAARIPLPDGSASLVFGEAMLSMQTADKKRLILEEVRRVLRPGGRYAIHELAARPDDIEDHALEALQKDLSSAIHVGVRIGTSQSWKHWLRAAGFEVESETRLPMRLLEIDRLIQDEGVWGTGRFVVNTVRTPGAWQRLRSVRGAFRKHRDRLTAVALIARRQ